MGLKFTAKDVQGIYNIIPTPAIAGADRFDAVDTVNYAETVKLVNMLIDNGVDAIVTNGTFGEGATLTEDELYGFVKKWLKLQLAEFLSLPALLP